jgi:hypothetical protein
LITLALLSAAGITLQAHADTVYTLNQSTTFGNVTSGTVDLKQNGLNNVLVTVALGPNFSFSPSSASNSQWGLALAFDLSGVSNVTASSITPSFVFDGLGSYGGAWTYAFTNTVPSALCAKAYAYDGMCGGQLLTFDLTATGLTTSNFVANGNFYFAANLLDRNGTDGTVMAAASVPSAVTPEPSSLFLSGTGLLGLAACLRRRATLMMKRAA